MSRVQPIQAPETVKNPPLSRKKTFSGYNPYQMPPDFKLAKIHAKAKRVYVSKQEDNIQEVGREVCVCCGLPVEGELIPLTASLERLYHLGSGYALYFSFIKYCIALLALLFAVSGIFNLVTNVSEGDCDESSSEHNEEYCVKGYILSFTLPNKRDNTKLLSAQLALNLVSVVLLMLFFHYFRYQSRKIVVAADDKTVTPSDYTIRIDGIPAEAKNSEIEAWLQGFATEERPIKVERIIRPYIINEYVALMNRSSKLNKNKEKIKRLDDIFDEKDKEKVAQIDAELEQIAEKLKTCKQEGLKHCRNVYVTFSTAHESIFIQSKFRTAFLSNFVQYFVSKARATEHFQGKNVKVRRAPEPTDILWENLGFSSAQRRKNKIYTVFITAILIIICFAIIVLINWGQEKAIVEFGEDSFVVQIFSVIASVFIFLTNYILSATIDYLANYEKHLTYTYYLKGVAEKLAVAQFLNTAIASLVAELILATDSDESKTGLQAINFYGKGGLFENIYWVFITSAFLTPVLTLINPGYIFQVIKQYWAESKGANLMMYQKKANALFEGPPLAITNRYATMIKIVLLTTFYAPGVPFSMIYTIIGLVICYWVEKYLLLRKNVLPNSIDDELADTMLEYLEWAAFTFAVGNIIYVYTLKNSVADLAFDEGSRVLVWISLGISLFHIIFPMELLNKKLFPIKDEITESQTYQEARLEFNTDYDIENPITRKRALKAFINRLKKKSNTVAKPEYLKKLEKGILGRIDMEQLMKVLEDKEAGSESKQPSIDEEEKIDFDFLDLFASNVQEVEDAPEEEKVAPSNRNLDMYHLDETRGALLNKVLQEVENLAKQDKEQEQEQEQEKEQEQEQEREPEPDPEPEQNQEEDKLNPGNNA